VPPRRLGKEILDRSLSIAFAHLHLVALVATDEVEVLGQGGKPRALRRGFGDQALGRGQVLWKPRRPKPSGSQRRGSSRTAFLRRELARLDA
jgi:hypothetical protein